MSFSSSIINYSEILEEIYRLPKSAAGERSLFNMKRLCSFLGHPESSFSTVHVAGTNGKGSVCTKIAAALQAQGYRTGLYTSPHISSFCERIQIDAVPISEEEVSLLYPEIQEAISRNGSPAAFFEIATLLAFLYFQKQNVEIAVIETGLGGAYDATNVVSPLVSVITSIGYDHQDILGPTLKEICYAKAGILKPYTPAVLGRTVPSDWILPTAKALQSRLIQTTTSYPSYDEENQAVALLALEEIMDRYPIEKEALEKGLKTKPPCRFEKRKFGEKDLILDVAHNPQGFERLIEELRHSYPGNTYRFVCGFSKGKEIQASARLIEALASRVHLVSGSHPRLASPKELAPYFNSCILEDSIELGIQNACTGAHSSDVIVVTGSFFIMAEARAFTVNRNRDLYRFHLKGP